MTARTPWEVLAASLTRLSDRVDAKPEVREATVATNSTDLTVLFDTDTVPTRVTGSLASGLLNAGDRVMTLKLRHYIWIIGLKNPIQIRLTTQNLNDIRANGSYVQSANANATAARNYPGVRAGVLEVAGGSGFTVQTYTDYQMKTQHVRFYYHVPNTWTPWTLSVGQDTGWVNITSGFASGFTTGSTPGQLAYRVLNGIVHWRGGVNGTIPTGAYTTVVTGIPAEARPPGTSDGQPYRTGAGFSGATPGFVEFHAAGSIVMAQSSGAGKVWGAFACSYPQG